MSAIKPYPKAIDFSIVLDKLKKIEHDFSYTKGTHWHVMANTVEAYRSRILKDNEAYYIESFDKYIETLANGTDIKQAYSIYQNGLNSIYKTYFETIEKDVFAQYGELDDYMIQREGYDPNYLNSDAYKGDMELIGLLYDYYLLCSEVGSYNSAWNK